MLIRGRERPSRLLMALALLAVGAVGADFASRAFRHAPPRAHRATSSQDTVASTGGESAGGGAAPAEAGADPRFRIRARIAGEADRTYVMSTLLATDSTIRRWPDERTARPLQVCVIRSWVDGFRDDFAGNLTYAVGRWNGVLPIELSTGADSATADIVVTWTPQLDSGKTGRTDLTWDRRGIIHHAFVTLATHDASGRLLDAPRMSALALHELGHALGLGHSTVKDDALYPIATALELSDRDRRTARLLYDLPPGSIR